MLELVNLSNDAGDQALIARDPRVLADFLAARRLDGVEMLLCAPWDERLHPARHIQGVHLRFWPGWLDFWRGDTAALRRELGGQDAVARIFGGPRREDWLGLYRRNIEAAARTRARYVVFHVSQARSGEVFGRRFRYDSRSVVRAALDVVNELTPYIPADTALLFENLWQPGLTLRQPELAAALLSGARHPHTGLMLNTGHLMNTRPSLRTEEEGVAYILRTVRALGAAGASCA